MERQEELRLEGLLPFSSPKSNKKTSISNFDCVKYCCGRSYDGIGRGCREARSGLRGGFLFSI